MRFREIPPARAGWDIGPRGAFPLCGMMAGMKKLAIIGGGAAGLAAAVAAASELRRLGLRVRPSTQGGAASPGADGVEVVVHEADDRVGRSILATGNGRCNFSNARVDAAAYRNAPFVGKALEALEALAASEPGGVRAPGSDAPTDPVHAFFADLGLMWREEGEGRLYPLANKATSVLDVLRAAAADAGARESCGRAAVRVDAPSREGERFHVRFADGAVEHADAVVVAVGGRAAGRLELPCPLACEKGRPVLGPLRTDAALVRQLNNIRVRCDVSLVDAGGGLKARERGEVLFRDYGVSGIAVFNLSRFAEPGDELRIDLLPQVPFDKAEGFLRARRKRLASAGRPCSGEAVLRGALLPAVAHAALKEAGLRPDAPFGKADAPALARMLKGMPLAVHGIGDARQCQVMRGGFETGAFDARTLEAFAAPGLFAAGEALDVDAPCGGYNLHWAWASGILAGRAAASRLAAGGARAKEAARA